MKYSAKTTKHVSVSKAKGRPCIISTSFQVELSTVAILISFSAKAVDSSFGKDVVETCVARFTCSVTASTILGWQYPVLATAHPARKSRYSSHRRPKVSLPRLDLLP